MSLLRTIIPPRLRARLRRSGIVRGYLKLRYSGIKSLPHPWCGCRVYFDGYRNLGWMFGGLEAAEAGEFQFALKQMRRTGPKCAWDVGANVGVWSLFFGSIDSVERVICFEPDPVNRRFLQLNKDRNQIARMEIRVEALSDSCGTAMFHSDDMTGATGTLEGRQTFVEQWYGAKERQISVPTVTIDALVESGTPPPDFMKIDVEGHELQVLRGGLRTLGLHHPTIVMEVTSHQEEIGSLLRGLGYQLVDATTGASVSVPSYSTGAVYESPL